MNFPLTQKNISTKLSNLLRESDCGFLMRVIGVFLNSWLISNNCGFLILSINYKYFIVISIWILSLNLNTPNKILISITITRQLMFSLQFCMMMRGGCKEKMSVPPSVQVWYERHGRCHRSQRRSRKKWLFLSNEDLGRE